MIAYFDTSAVVPLLIEEPASAGAVRLWDEATRIVSTHLLYPEARSALARAQRVGRLSEDQHTLAKHGLESLCRQVDQHIVTALLARRAGQLAEDHALRGYDAVHLAAAEASSDESLVVVSADLDLCAAASALGLNVANLI